MIYRIVNFPSHSTILILLIIAVHENPADGETTTLRTLKEFQFDFSQFTSRRTFRAVTKQTVTQRIFNVGAVSLNCQNHCKACTTDNVCIKCNEFYGTDPSNTAACSPCATGCLAGGCAKSGGGKCDAPCASPFTYDPSTFNCSLPERISSFDGFSIYPDRGPLGGGTLITARFDDLGQKIKIGAQREILIYFSGVTQPIDIKESLFRNNQSNEIQFSTPPGFYPGPAVIYMVITGYISNLYGLNTIFTYLDAPVFTSISPTHHFVTGGTTLTINGNNLMNGENYSLLLRINITEIGVTGLKSFSTANTTCDSSRNADGYIKCLVPTVSLPFNFNISQQSEQRRQNTSSFYRHAAYYLSSDGKELASVELYICQRKDKCAPLNAPIIWVPEPKIGREINLIEVEEGVRKTVAIEGERLLTGAQETDYLLTVGKDECRINQKDNCWLVSVEDNSITISLPLYEPSERNNDECSKGMDLIVSLGEKSYLEARYACVHYIKQNSTLMYIIIGAAGGGGLLLIILVVIITCCVCCSKKRRQRRAKARQNGNEEKKISDNHKSHQNAYSTSIGK